MNNIVAQNNGLLGAIWMCSSKLKSVAPFEEQLLYTLHST
jgi:hypothetical protein